MTFCNGYVSRFKVHSIRRPIERKSPIEGAGFVYLLSQQRVSEIENVYILFVENSLSPSLNQRAMQKLDGDFDVNEICRLCLQQPQDGSWVALFTSNLPVSPSTMITRCTRIEVKQGQKIAPGYAKTIGPLFRTGVRKRWSTGGDM